MTTTQWAEINFDVQNVPSRPDDEVTTVNVIDTDRIIATMISDLEYHAYRRQYGGQQRYYASQTN